MLKKIYLLIILLISTKMLIANNKGEKDMMSILQDKPVFMIRVESEYANFIVTLNGVKVYNGIDGTSISLEIPVNHLITSGENELKVQLVAWNDMNYTLNKSLKCKVSLRVKKFEDFSVEPKTISTVIYNNGQENPLDESRKEGKYNSNKDFSFDKGGDISISDIKLEALTFYQGDKIGGVMLSQHITLETPFSKWKFLDSEKIIDERYDELSNELYEQLRKREDIVSLYKIYKTIYDALEKKDVDSIIGLFDERNREMDSSMYHTKEPYYRNRLYEKLKDNVNDSSRELLKWNESKMYFFIEENGRLIYIDGAIAFNDKDGSTSTSYPILFRKEKDKWIISR